MSKEHINLPKTKFSMKANLPNKEPNYIEFWKKIDLYNLLRQKSKGQEKFVLHFLQTLLLFAPPLQMEINIIFNSTRLRI